MSSWQEAAELATRHGLGIVLAVMLGLLFVLIIRRLLKSFEESRITYDKIIANQRELISEYRKDMVEILKYVLKHTYNIKREE